MNKQTGIILIGLAAVVTAVVVYVQFDRDARRINKRLTELKKTLEKSAGDAQLRTLAKANRVTGFFAPEAVLTLRPILSETIKRDQIAPIVMQAHSRLDRLDIVIRDRRLEIDSAAGTAVQRFTVHASTGGRGREQHRHVNGFKLYWVKIDREWYINRAEIIEAIRAPGSVPDSA